MVQFAIIIVIIISLVAGFYAIVLLGGMRKKYQIEFLNGFFYYQILHFLFGLYGILGNIAVQQILLKFDLKESNIGVIALFFPFFGIPFIVAAWYLLMKMATELVNKKVHQFVAIGYFILATSAFLVYGRYMQKMPNVDYHSFSGKLIVVFCIIDLVVAGYFSSITIIHSFTEKMVSKRIYLIRCGLLVAALSVLRSTSMYFADYFLIIGLYFLLIYFAGNLSIILLTKVQLTAKSSDYHTLSADIIDIFLKYGISNREKEIIHEICKGKTNQQIADDLFISLQTVKDHTYNIFRKVDVKNRVQLTKIFNQFIN
jgi:DNA-binding CsgD family transcriptional regulator